MKTAEERRQDAEGVLMREVDAIMRQADEELSRKRRVYIPYNDHEAARICAGQLTKLGYNVSIHTADNYKSDNEISITY